MISFSSVPSIGTKVLLDEQAFELIDTEPHVRKDGRTTTLLVWRASCAECGVEYVWRSPMVNSGLTRRCVEHSKAGTPVSGKVGKKVVVQIIEPETTR